MENSQKKLDFIIFLGSFIFILLIGMVDYLTGDLSFILFYLLPIVLTAWYGSLNYSIIIAGLCLIVWLFCNVFFYTPVELNKTLLLVWSILDKIFFFVLTIYFIEKVKITILKSKHK